VIVLAEAARASKVWASVLQLPGAKMARRVEPSASARARDAIAVEAAQVAKAVAAAAESAEATSTAAASTAS